MMRIIVYALVLGTLLMGCENEEDARVKRWYTPQQVAQGQALFQQNCMACHGDKAQGLTSNWNQPDADGAYPPPPLNGTAHAWHHPLNALKYTIREGGIKMGGRMPGFGDKLSPAEQEAVIAWFQSLWSDTVYAAWLQRGGLDKQ